MALQHLRASTADKRPTPAAMADGQLAMNTNLASPGLFFKDSNGDLVKTGPVHVGTTAPNATPASGGQAGNSKGELWLDTTGSDYTLKTWDGSAWREIVVTSTMIKDGTIVNADVNASAAIAGTKVAPDFGSQTITTTGVFSHALGAVGTPSITFTGDLNTGIYSPGADQLAISTNGTGRLFVASDGNVGIGGAPAVAFRLDVIGSSIATRQSTAGDQGILLLKGNAGATAGATIESSFSAGGYGPLIFNTNNSEVARFTQTGRLGLGTSSPASILHVNQNVASGNYQSRITLENSDQRTIIGSYWESGVGQYSIIQSTNEAENTSQALLLNPSGGNVGIGTTSPGSSLDVNGSIRAGNYHIIDGSTAAAGAVGFSTSNGPSLQFWGSAAAGSGSLIATTAGSERARIDSSGRLLVGTSSQSGGSLLQVNDNRIRIATAKTPASATDTGVAGEICWDANYVYVCTATNTWKRTAISTW